MKTIGIADLKTHMSRYLREVRKGRRLLVMDRSEPVAEIVPYQGRGAPDPWRDLALDGMARVGSQDWGSMRVTPLGRKIDVASVLDALRDEAP